MGYRVSVRLVGLPDTQIRPLPGIPSFHRSASTRPFLSQSSERQTVRPPIPGNVQLRCTLLGLEPSVYLSVQPKCAEQDEKPEPTGVCPSVLQNAEMSCTDESVRQPPGQTVDPGILHLYG